jgi:hypothetical protein
MKPDAGARYTSDRFNFADLTPDARYVSTKVLSR